jgi:hypothetical protein
VFWVFRDFSRNVSLLAGGARMQGRRSLTVFDTPGHFLTLGDKTGLFLAVFLKKVDVL